MSGTLERQAAENQNQIQEEAGEGGENERGCLHKAPLDLHTTSNKPQTERGHATSLKDNNSNTDEENDENPTPPAKRKQNSEESQSMKDQEPNPIFRFGVGSSEAQNKRVYRTTDLSLSFWKALELKPPSVTGASRLVVISMLIKKRWTSEETTKLKFLAIKTWRLNNAVLESKSQRMTLAPGWLTRSKSSWSMKLH